MAAYMRKEAELEGGKHKGNFKGSDEDLRTMMDWLAALDPPAGE